MADAATQTATPSQLENAPRKLLIQARVDLCPIKESARILGKKWYLVIIHRLLGKRMGFNELKEAVGDVSAKILSQALRDLQDKGIILRRLASESPLRVEYQLTEKGEDLDQVLTQLYDWGKNWAICKHGQPVDSDRRFRSPSPGGAPASDADVHIE